jgi:cytochrome o ubiquinol oxidase operon protein cyoD
MTGFVLAVILTAIPFWLVMDKVLGKSSAMAMVILGIGAVQMNTKSEGGWTMLALIFTLVLVVIVLSGSLWVMYQLDHNMMPSPTHDMRNMP